MFFYYEKYTNNLPKKVVVYPTQNMDVQFDTIPVEIPFTYKNNLSQTEVKTNLKVSLNFRACQVNINKPGFVFFISSKEKKISFQIKFIYSDAVNKKVYNQDTAIKNDYSIDDKYEGIIIKTEKADDLIAVCREIGNEEFAKISIEDLFIRRLKVENSAEELRFLYENLPDFVLNKLFALIGEKMLLQHLMILTEYDDTGLFSGFKDGSSALINILKAFNDSDTLYNLFKNDQVLVKRIYGNLDGTSEYENQTKSNKIIFSSLLYGLCVKNGFNGLERKDKTFYYGNEYKFDANVSAVRNDEKNDEFFIQQLRVIPLFGADILYPLTENIEEDKGSMYHPLEIVQFIDMDSKDKQPLPMPAIFVKALSDEVELQEIETSIRIGFDLLGVVLGVIVTSTTGNPTLFALALADIGLATTDGAIQSFKKEILELEGGEEFIATWEKIYLVGGAITAGPVVISSFLKLGTSILRLAEIAKNFNALKFTQTCMMKVILEIEIANFTKNTVKEIIFGEEALKATGTSFNMAGVTRLQKEGVLFIKAINSDGKAGNIAVIYKGEAIASGTAKEVRESLKDLWASRGVLLSNQLNEIFEVTNFISKLSSKLKTEVNEAFFWSGHTDRV
jgi:hypothetical protein